MRTGLRDFGMDRIFEMRTGFKDSVIVRIFHYDLMISLINFIPI